MQISSVFGHDAPWMWNCHTQLLFSCLSRVIVPQSYTAAYSNSNLMKRDNIVQVSGDISYRFYFEPQIQMYVPYVEFIASQLRFFRNPAARQDRPIETETETETVDERDADRQVLDAMGEGKDISGYEDK